MGCWGGLGYRFYGVVSPRGYINECLDFCHASLGSVFCPHYSWDGLAIFPEDLTLSLPPTVVVQSLSHVQFFETPWTTALQASLSFTTSQSLLRLMSIELMMPSNHLILCHPLLLLPSILPSIRVFSNESVLVIWWPKYWSFSISPSHEYSGLISFRID